MVVSAVSDLFFDCYVLQKLFHCFRSQIGNRCRTDSNNHATHSSHYELYMLWSILSKTFLKSCQMLGEGSLSPLGQSLLLWIDKATLTEHHFVLKLRCKTLGLALVAKAFDG